MTPAAERIAAMIEALVDPGFVVIDDLFDAATIAAMRAEAVELDAAGELRAARVGLLDHASRQPQIRGDRIGWLDMTQPSAVQRPHVEFLAQLQQAINRELFLGLHEFEGHYALYPPGSFYGPHMDRFAGTMHRVVTCILYLNDDWQPEDGGLLRLYLDERGQQGPYLDIAPLGGRCVVFVSERFLHEVLPARRERVSLTGWFRVRSTAEEDKRQFRPVA